ncbi:uncharacterized protein LOC131676778 [Topomyia yanbarensis]|uniref:uncharacterized protein LOC131676778 n=1 Tax=Topomyia yanbarensis TaxID=2498891 RepID=UPI00273B2F7B|nr:uncharacterized protein LOC131676778 [Topomyia yanbarensis]
MRNCFIPKCDQSNKHNPKRAMFNVPMKDPVLLSRWIKALPKHRPLKEFDRVCEIHFEEEDILRYWEHTINGQVERMERKKPALRPSAVPCYIEISDNSYFEALDSQVSGVGSKRKIDKKTSNSYVKKTKLEQMEEKQLVAKHDTANMSSQKNNGKNDDKVVARSVVIEVSQMVHPEFEALYDDVYEVELPSPLWGIHRDVEKTFISFTEFNQDTMNTRKCLYIDQRLRYRQAVGQRIMREGTLKNSTTEAISELLSTLDEIKVRKIIIKGNSVLKES